jgi:hypothetical protein
MSQVSPGWYPDPSGRFAQRYHDGTRWTEHVADANGNRATDVPEAQARPTSAYGQQGAGGRDWGHAGDAAADWSAADEGRPSGGATSAHTADQAGAEGWPGEQAGATGWSGERAGAPAGDQTWSDAGGQPGGQPGAQPWATAQAPRIGGPGRPPSSQSPSAGTAHGYDGGQGYGSQPGYGQRRTYGRPNYAYGPPAASARGFTPTIGLIVAVVGGLLLLLSLFGLDFLEFSVPGFSETVSLADVAGDFGDDAPFAIDTYASFGRFLAVVVIVVAILAALRVIPLFQEIPAPVIMAAVCGAFALWHVLAMLSSAENVDVSPTFGAILGLLGYVGLAAGPFLKQPLGPTVAAGVEH